MKRSYIYYSIGVILWFAVVIMFIVSEDPRTPFVNLLAGMMGGILPAGIFYTLGLNAEYDEIERDRIKAIEKRRSGIM